MNASQLIPALFVAAITLYVIVYLGRSILNPLFGFLLVKVGSGEKRRVQKKLQLLEEADRALDAGNYDGALLILRRAFHLDLIRKDLELISRVGALHLSILNKILLIAELTSIRLTHLPILEELLSARIQLMKQWNEARLLFEQTKKKRDEKGAPLPDWASKEYKSKQDDVSDKLKTNRSSIEQQVEKLFTELSKSSQTQSSDVTYH
ncbi:MAG: hypothetical protein KDD55_01805 [Bdellovibrionales bacterium]|nr:hypothetical protein [Bdellovibrionales bacterium]